MIQSNGSPILLAEDEHVKVIFQPGQSEFLLITFGDMFMMAEGLRFFADTPIRKQNISCIGFMAKSRNWYPEISMIPLIDTIRSHLRNFREIICYGGSMGGYAAIKYSKALGSTSIIALCPQWSIDRDECDAIDPVWEESFSKEYLGGMGIRSSDCSGTAFVFFDNFNKTDTFHARQIQKVLAAHLISVPRVDHHVTPALAGTENLRRLITYCRDRNLDAIKSLVRVCRRRSEIRIEKVIAFAEKRFPSEVSKRVTRSFQEGPLPEIDLKYAMMGMRSLAKSNDHARASAAFAKYKHKFDHIERMHASALFITHSTQLDVYLKTFHDTVVCYDIGRNILVHCHVHQMSNIDTLLPIRILIDEIGVLFYVDISDRKIYLCYENGTIKITYDLKSIFRFSLESDQDAFKFNCRGRYLTSELGSNRVNCNREQAADWERFTLGIG